MISATSRSSVGVATPARRASSSGTLYSASDVAEMANGMRQDQWVAIMAVDGDGFFIVPPSSVRVMQLALYFAEGAKRLREIGVG